MGTRTTDARRRRLATVQATTLGLEVDTPTPQRKPRRMSCAMTVEAVEQRIKWATRRAPASWANLRPGDPLILIKKGRGLPKGAKQEVITQVVVVSNRVETLGDLTEDEIELEGFDPGGELAPEPRPELWLSSSTAWESPACKRWAAWWAAGHQVRPGSGVLLDEVKCRRIEWKYQADGGTK